MIKIIGLDIALNKTGWAYLEDDKLEKYGLIELDSKTWNSSSDRILIAASQIITIVELINPDIVSIEDTFYRTNFPALKPILYLQGALRRDILKKIGKYPVSYMATSARVKFGLSGRAEKEEIIKAVNSKYSKRIKDDNIADAIVVAHCAYVEFKAGE